MEIGTETPFHDLFWCIAVGNPLRYSCGFAVAFGIQYKTGESRNLIIQNMNDLPLRARHHTSPQAMKEIQRCLEIYPARGELVGVHVEVEPFGQIAPGKNGPQRETGAAAEGAFVEFDLPKNAVATNVGPRHTAVIPIAIPLQIARLNPQFVIIRRWWNLWYCWRRSGG